MKCWEYESPTIASLGIKKSHCPWFRGCLTLIISCRLAFSFLIIFSAFLLVFFLAFFEDSPDPAFPTDVVLSSSSQMPSDDGGGGGSDAVI